MSLHISEKVQRQQVMLTERQRAHLKRLAKEQDRSISEVLREILDEGLEKRQPKRKKIMDIVGMFSGDGEDLSNEDMDAIIYRKDWD